MAMTVHVLSTGQGTAAQQGEVWPLAGVARLHRKKEKDANVPVWLAAAW